jgi:hypothetical protein
MLRKLLAFIFIIICTSIASIHAQNESAIKVTLTDKVSKETIPFANVVVEMGGIQVAVGTTNIDGEAMIKPLNPGRYNVKATYVGYQAVQIDNVAVPVGKTVYLKMELTAGQQLKEVEVVEYSVPLIDPDTKSGTTVSREDYKNMASKDINSVAASTAGVYAADQGEALNVRGSRSNGTAYYVDGQKVVGGSPGLPQSSIEQISTIIGGTPAEFGDATGGIISITTRGPSNNFTGGLEVITSGAGEKKGLDAYGYNFIGFGLNGPILFKKDTNTTYKKSILGFSISGEASTVVDGDPFAGGTYRVKKDKLTQLEESPIMKSPNGNGYVKSADYVTMNDLEKIKAKQNVRQSYVRLNYKFQYQPTTNFGITLGGSVNYNNGNSYVYDYALFNPSNNPQTISNSWRTFIKLTQKFNSATTKEEEKSSSVIKNAYFTIQASYALQSSVTQDDTHKDNFFDYGYIGKFTQQKTKGISSYEPLTASTAKYDINGDGIKDSVNAYFQNALPFNSGLLFTPGDKNPTGTNYTEQFYNLKEGKLPIDGQEVQSAFGLLNGDRPGNVYSLWLNTGRQYGGYSKTQNTQFRVFANFSADIKKHAIQVGFEFEQRVERGFALSPIELWGQMRALTNLHTQRIDSLPIYVGMLDDVYPNTSNLPNLPVYDFNSISDAKTQTQFDKSIRDKLGYDVRGTDWVDIDKYDPSTYSLGMFSADELLGLNGNKLVAYNGYDYTGKKTSGPTNLDDFFNKKDAEGNFIRAIGAFQPIYVAGYIQDKFDYKDLKCNLGLRIDRFDANQKVLKDKYLVYEAYTAAEVDYSKFNTSVPRPGNIGDDYVVYVNNKSNATKILGYRNNDTWYDENGKVVDANFLKNGADGGVANPYLLDPTDKTASAKAFKDYVPQINVMPRIAFAFPISDAANFFAHYDVLTQRPPQGNRLDPTQYLINSTFMNNPDLKTEKTIDYEVGFTQVLNEKKNSALTINVFYKELRDMIQLISVNQAYPVTYTTYGNLDFGTVKGVTIAYDLRRTAGVRLTTNYTIQFADGTGSSASDGGSLASRSLPPIRFTNPFSYDQRHVIKLNFDYRFGGKKVYRGPVLTIRKGTNKEKSIKLFENMGANFQFQAGSGRPFTRQQTVTQAIAIDVAQGTALRGDINGSTMPWSYKIDLRVDKDIELTWGKKANEEKKHANLNIYLQVLNLLNTRNVKTVYKYTGSPSDDGFLSSLQGQNQIANQTSPTAYADQYSLKVANPNNFSQARVIRLGLLLEF